MVLNLAKIWKNNKMVAVQIFSLPFTLMAITKDILEPEALNLVCM
jgi:hypothetical protein